MPRHEKQLVFSYKDLKELFTDFKFNGRDLKELMDNWAPYDCILIPVFNEFVKEFNESKANGLITRVASPDDYVREVSLGRRAGYVIVDDSTLRLFTGDKEYCDLKCYDSVMRITSYQPSWDAAAEKLRDEMINIVKSKSFSEWCERAKKTIEHDFITEDHILEYASDRKGLEFYLRPLEKRVEKNPIIPLDNFFTA